VLRYMLARAALVWLSMSPVAALACDCAIRNANDCTASVQMRSGKVTLRTSTPKCAFVEYTVNGDRTSDTVEGGYYQTDYTSVSAISNGNWPADSCSICRPDTANGGGQPGLGGGGMPGGRQPGPVGLATGGRPPGPGGVLVNPEPTGQAKDLSGLRNNILNLPQR